jgi:hypothetical protein
LSNAAMYSNEDTMGTMECTSVRDPEAFSIILRCFSHANEDTKEPWRLLRCTEAIPARLGI